MQLTYSQRKKLKEIAHRLRPVVQIGKRGLTNEVMKAIDDALNDHELIKVQFIDYKEEKKLFIEKIRENTHAEVVGVVGHRVILYRENPHKQHHVLNGDGQPH
ncbi:MAG: ribosome assembly RNA-binding protein YhbY [Spirochaetes bacterium]|nr:ribosome assembly RNA-binding protein YhbY [Spirochaetota bacterium]